MSHDIVFGQYLESFFPFEIEHEHTQTATYVIGSPDMGKSTLLGTPQGVKVPPALA